LGLGGNKDARAPPSVADSLIVWSSRVFKPLRRPINGPAERRRRTVAACARDTADAISVGIVFHSMNSTSPWRICVATPHAALGRSLTDVVLDLPVVQLRLASGALVGDGLAGEVRLLRQDDAGVRGLQQLADVTLGDVVVSRSKANSGVWMPITCRPAFR
jgi:hypothetical protein